MFGRLGSVAAGGRALTTTAIARALGAAGLTDAQARAAIGGAASLDDGLRAVGLLPKLVAAVPPTPNPNPNPTPSNGTTRPDFADLGLVPDFAYHPHTANRAISGQEVRSVTGQGGSPDLTAPTTGPDEVTYASGLKAWRFENTDYLELPTSFTSTPQAMTMFFVVRQHRSDTINYFGHSFLNDGVSVANTAGAFVNTSGSGGILAVPRSGSRSSGAVTGKEYMAVGTQPTVLGVAGRSSANGGTRFFVNGRTADQAANPSSAVDLRGGRIGGYANGNGSTNGFDLIYVACFKGTLTNAQAQAINDRLMQHFAIVDTPRQIVLEGDSITAGVVEVTSGYNVAMALTEPGAGLIPADVRVLNMGVSGATVPLMRNRRDVANGWPIALLPGGSANNILAFQIGRNDSASGGRDAPSIRDDMVAYTFSDATSVFSRGFDARVVMNVANGSMAVLGPLRDLIRDPAFATLMAAQDGGANAGRLGFVDLSRIEQPAGTRRFDVAADAQSAVYYQTGDTTHPNRIGTALMASGGETPQHGYGGIW